LPRNLPGGFATQADVAILFNESKRIGAAPATAGSRLDQHQCAAAAFMNYF
jgi:hypothetical protein